jgi:hypothetical protein
MAGHQVSGIFNVRLEPDMLRAIELELAKRNSNPLSVYWTKSDWVRKAIAEKLAHSQRGRKSRRRSGRPSGPSDVADDDADRNSQDGVGPHPLLQNTADCHAGLVGGSAPNVPKSNGNDDS